MANYQRLGSDINESLVTPQMEGSLTEEDIYVNQDLMREFDGIGVDVVLPEPQSDQAEESKALAPTEQRSWRYDNFWTDPAAAERLSKDLSFFTFAQAATDAGMAVVESALTGERDPLGAATQAFLNNYRDDYEPETRPAMRLTKQYFVPDEEGQKESTIMQEAVALGLEVLGESAFGGSINLARKGGVKLSDLVIGATKDIVSKRFADEATETLAGKIAGKKLELLDKMAARGDKQAQEKLMEMSSNPEVIAAIGKATPLKKSPELESAYLEELNSMPPSNLDLTHQRVVEKARAEGDVALYKRELDGFYSNNPYDLNKVIWDMNSPNDVHGYVMDTRKFFEGGLYKAFKNAKGKDKKVLAERLSTQPMQLELNIGDKVIADVDEVTAFAYNQVFDQMYTTLAKIMNKEKDMVFSSGKDMVIFHKILAMRAQMVADLTGKRSSYTRVLTSLNTSTVENSVGIRMQKIAKAKDRASRITPASAKRLEDLGGAKVETLQAISPEQFSELRRLVGGGNIKGAAEELKKMSPDEFKQLMQDARVAASEAPSGPDIVAKMLTTARNKKQISNMLNLLQKRNWLDKAHQWWIVSILSDAVTHGVNATSNATEVLITPFKFTSSAIVSSFNNPAYAKTNLKAAGDAVIGSAEAALGVLKVVAQSGMNRLARNTDEAASLALAEKRNNITALGGNRDMHTASSSYSDYGVSRMPIQQRISHYGSKLIQTPIKALNASDQLFKAMNYEATRRVEARFAASSMAKNPVEEEIIFKELLSNTPDYIKTAGYSKAQVKTYQQELSTNLKHYANVVKGAGARWFVPFITTPSNIARMVANHTPILNTVMPALNRLGINGFLVKNNSLVRDLEAGGARAQAAIGTLSLTNGAFVALMMAPTEGVITGGGGLPMPNAERTPYEPYMITFPGGAKYYYGRNPILKTIIGVPVTLKEIFHQIDWEHEETADNLTQFSTAITTLFATTLIDETFFNQFARTFAALQAAWTNRSWEPLQKQVMRTAVTLAVPYSGTMRTYKRMVDPYAREMDGYFQTLMNRYGIGYMDNPMSIDLFGHRRYDSFDGSQHGVNMSGTDPFTRELRRLRPSIPDVPTIDISKNIPEADREYSLEERHFMRSYIATGEGMGGVPFKAAIIRIFASPEYRLADDAHRRELVEHEAHKYINTAVTALSFKRQTGMTP